jgi:hypothetical protein
LGRTETKQRNKEDIKEEEQIRCQRRGTKQRNKEDVK